MIHQPSTRILLVLAITTLGAALAHHGWSSYNQDELLEFTGIIRELHFENPHSEMMLELLSEDQPTGEVWEVVLPPPGRAQRLGLTAETLTVDMIVTVEGHQHQTVEREMRATSILFGDATEPLALR